MIAVRPATSLDCFAVGCLLMESIESAPSADRGPDELPSAELDAGAEVVEPALANGDVLLVAELDGALAGLVWVWPRELARARHVGDLYVLVHPDARGRGIGSALLDAAWLAAGQGGRALEKLAVRAASDDDALGCLLAGHGWRLERVERCALARDEGVFDVMVWGRLLRGPVPGV